MMPNITRGGRMAGLMVYLAGGGRANEHTDQHVIAGHDVVTQAVGSAPLTTDTALDLANVVEQPSRVFGTEILTPSKLYDPHTGEHVRTEMVDGHVWHASLSIKADEGKLSDAQWSKIANDFVDGMGFVDRDGAKSNRWVAVRHGSSKAGNDHIHIAVNLVREDGTKANVWQDYHRSQKLSHELEKKYGLDVLQSREKGAGLSADKPAEQRRAVEGERTATMRDDLRRRLRAAVASSTGEASFIQAVKNNRVLVRPRFEQGGTSKVVGYSAALIPGDGKGEPKQPIWYAPSKLDRTLGLTRLRATWGTEAATPEALSGWVGMQKDLRERSVDVTAKVKREQILTAQMQRMIDREKQLTPDKDNRLSLAHKPEVAAVADLANVYSRVSMSLEGGKPGPIQQASDEYARLAQQKGTPAPTVAANLAYQSRLMTRGMGRDSRTGWIAVFRQMERLGNSIQNVHRAKGDLATAELLRGRSVAALAAAQQHLARIEAAQGRSAPTAQQNVQGRVNRETSERDAGTEIER